VEDIQFRNTDILWSEFSGWLERVFLFRVRSIIKNVKQYYLVAIYLVENGYLLG